MIRLISYISFVIVVLVTSGCLQGSRHVRPSDSAEVLPGYVINPEGFEQFFIANDETEWGVESGRVPAVSCVSGCEIESSINVDVYELTKAQLQEMAGDNGVRPEFIKRLSLTEDGFFRPDSFSGNRNALYFELNFSGSPKEDLVSLASIEKKTNFLLIPGDATLDQRVDAKDLVVIEENLFSEGHDWAGGDFDGNGIVDVLDYNLWNEFRYILPSNESVPKKVIKTPVAEAVQDDNQRVRNPATVLSGR